MTRRFFLSQPVAGVQVTLTGREAHHLLRVMRLSVGDAVTLFDGAGGEARATIIAAGEGSAELAITEWTSAAADHSTALTLATAVPKGERFDWLVEKCTELGVARLVPLVTERSIVHPRPGKLERLRRTIVEASKQCGRNRLMELADSAPLAEFAAAELPAGAAWVADPAGAPAAVGWRSLPRTIAVVIGPEGGLTSDELELLTGHGARRVSLAATILRIETAGVAAAALVASHDIDR